jgi:hypothetical protein
MKKALVSEKQEARAAAPPPLFVNANKGPGLTPDFEAVVESVFNVDARAEYEDLEKSLFVGEQRGDYGTLLKALDEAETKARRAHKLYLGAKLEQTNWQLNADVTDGAMREAAMDELEAEKELGERKKMITEADVKGRMQSKFPDQFRHQAQQRVKVEGTVKHLERLSELWMGRCRTLGTMLGTLRK